MMSRAVLDSSALLSVLNREAGSEKLSAELLTRAVCSTVNVAEVHTKLVSRGLTETDAWIASTSVVEDLAEFSLHQARIAGRLVSQTRGQGLSLGDRACLALAIELDLPVYTADRSWKQLTLPIRIHVIR
jgi:PIN domain nuclease of toxin-antitoxin system